MSSPEDDPTRSPDESGESGGLGDMGADLQAALGDLLGGDDAADGGDDGADDDLDLHALEDAVAELGIDIVDDGPDDAPPAPPPPPPASSNPGLDLTEAPPPPAPAASAEPPARKLPPLGQASADDLFGPLDDDWDDGGDFGGEPSAPDLADLPPPPSAEPVGAEPSVDAPDPVQLPAPEPPPPAADPTSDEMVAYAAHRGRLTGEIAAKARKLFGR